MLSYLSHSPRTANTPNFFARVRRHAYYSIQRFINLILIAALIAPGVSGPVEAMALDAPPNRPSASAPAANDGTAMPTATPLGESTLAPAASEIPTDEVASTLEPLFTPLPIETATPEPTATPTETPVPEPTSDSPYAIAITDLIPEGLPLIMANTDSLNGATTESVQVPASGAAVLFMGERVGVIIPPKAFSEPVNLTLRPQPIKDYNPSVISSTIEFGLGTGPDQAPIRFTLEAYRVSDDQLVKTFSSPVQLVFNLRGLKGIASSPNWTIAYQDEQDETLWHRLDTTVHDKAGLISVKTTHFSGWYGSPDPGAWHYQWNLPTASTFSGAATYRYPIEVPPGRGGLTPNIDFSYSSRGVDGLVLSNQDQGPLGLGWSLNNIEISRNGIFIWGDGAHMRMQHPDSFQLVLNGESHNLVPEGSTSASIVRYYAENGPQLFVQRIYDPNAIGANPDKFYWLVKAGDGTTYRLGYTPDAESGQTGFVDTVGHTGDPAAPSAYSGIRWRVDTVTDVYGNQIQYDYASWTQDDTYYHEPQHTPTTITTGLRRITEIRYNFLNLATGYSDRRPVGEVSTKIVFVGSSDNKRVAQIKLHHIDLTTPYRLIDISRDSVIHADCGQATTTDRVLSIRQLNNNGTIALPTTLFTYIDKSHAWGTCYRYDYLEQVDNGYGGKVKFTYDWDGRIGDWSCNCIPAFGASWFVIKTETWDGINTTASITDYAYQVPCYDQTGGALGGLAGAFSCPTHAPISGLIAVQPYNDGSLVGFNQTAITHKDYDGKILDRSLVRFSQSSATLGQALLTQSLDPSSALVVPNFGAEVDANWYIFGPTTLSYATTELHSGRRSLKVDTTALTPDHGLGNDLTGWQAGRTYWLNLYVKSAGAGQQVCLNVYTGVNEVSLSPTPCVTATGTWQLMQGTITLPSNATGFSLRLRPSAIGTIYVDDMTAGLFLRNYSPLSG